ncbi:hypothetical protein BDW62DRAFT_196814 [Aspergillus aurantiobrunneus]
MSSADSSQGTKNVYGMYDGTLITSAVIKAISISLALFPAIIAVALTILETMQFRSFAWTLSATLLIPASTVTAQAPKGIPYIDATTNITFSAWELPAPSDSDSDSAGSLKFGLALPPTALETDATEFIGLLQCTPVNGWCGISLGGSMTDSLLLVAYADEKADEPADVKHTLRFTTEYSFPGVYKGNSTVMPIRSELGKDSFTSIFLCRECLRWAHDGRSGMAATSSGTLDLAYALSSEGLGGDVGCPGEVALRKHSMQGTWVGFVDEGVVSEKYKDWAGKATDGGSDGC